MKKVTNTYSRYDVVKVHFPFVDQNSTKKRPALVLANFNINSNSGVCILSMITSKKSNSSSWPMDIVIQDLEASGLPIPSIIRFKIFTLDHRLILGQIGKLSKKDQTSLKQILGQIF